MTLPTTFDRIRPVRLYERIVEQIESRIASGELRPGHRLPSERDLVTQFGASRSTVREALRVLEAGGLVRSRPGDPRGPEIMIPEPVHLQRQLARHATASRMTLVELVGSRMILDAAAVRLAARLRTEAEVAEMAATIEAMQAALDDGHDAFAEADLAFHEVVARASHNTLVQACNAAVRDVVVRLVATRISGDADAVALMRLSLDHHRTVLEAIRRGDGEGAARDCTLSLFAYYAIYLDEPDRETLRALLD